MLQQRFSITLFFSLAIFLIKFLLFFVQFSVHFLFFTCFFYYKKILHLFHFLLFLTLSHALLILLFFGANFQPWTPGPAGIPDSIANQRKRGRAAARSPELELYPKHRSMGFCCLRVFVFCVWIVFFFVFECMLFSLHLYTYVTFL